MFYASNITEHANSSMYINCSRLYYLSVFAQLTSRLPKV